MPTSDFDAVRTRISDVEGWLTDAQARRLLDRVSDLGLSRVFWC